MKLKDKGPIEKPPILKDWAQKASVEIQSWEGIISATHWEIGDSTKPNGADFYVGKKELGHIHLDGEIHIKLTKSLRDEMIEAELAEKFPWGDNWIQNLISDKKTMDAALWLFRFGYDRLNGVKVSDLQKRIIERQEKSGI